MNRPFTQVQVSVKVRSTEDQETIVTMASPTGRTKTFNYTKTWNRCSPQLTGMVCGIIAGNAQEDWTLWEVTHTIMAEVAKLAAESHR